MLWTLDQFKEEYEFYVTKVGKYTEESLFVFFSSHQHKLPLYRSDRIMPPYCLNSSKEHLFHQEDMIIKDVPISNLFGNTWLYNNEREYGRPKPNRLARIFMAKHPDDLPPILVEDLLNGSYLAEEGNHRIYSAYLRGWDSVKVQVVSSIPLYENE